MTYLSKLADNEWKYPQPDLVNSGKLEVSQDPPHKIHWEEYGNPDGEPVMFVHGGPGAGFSAKYARFFDPNRYRIILFDQRGCGKSEPSASANDAAPALANNTTDHSIEDMSALRAELGIKGKMHLFGGSWGSTLPLAYAIKHPETVQSLNLRGIFLLRKKDLDYFYQGNAETYAENPQNTTLAGAYMFYPEAWKQFVEIIPPEKRGDMVAAYAEIFAMTPDNPSTIELQTKAATAWSVWEGVTSYLAQDTKDLSRYEDPEFAKAFAKIENHYFMNGGFLGGTQRDQNYIVENVDKIKNIPISIIQGQYDQVCPRFQADELVAALHAVGANVDYQLTPAGHSMLERETNALLTANMDGLPPMTALDKTIIQTKRLGRAMK